MPLYMDHHKNLEGLTAEAAVAEDHQQDLEVQDKHEAKALRYWFSEEKGEVYCLFEAPSAEAAEAVHREAHGNVAALIRATRARRTRISVLVLGSCACLACLVSSTEVSPAPTSSGRAPRS